jgi:hypothetical protein
MNAHTNIFSNMLSSLLNEDLPPTSQQVMRLMTQYIHAQNDFNSNMTRMIQMLDRPTVTLDFTNLIDLSANLQRLTPNQIDLATTTYNYVLESDQIASQPSQSDTITCPITLEPIAENESVIKINRCGHIFKKPALLRWLERDSRCPVCRCTINN